MVQPGIEPGTFCEHHTCETEIITIRPLNLRHMNVRNVIHAQCRYFLSFARAHGSTQRVQRASLLVPVPPPSPWLWTFLSTHSSHFFCFCYLGFRLVSLRAQPTFSQCLVNPPALVRILRIRRRPPLSMSCTPTLGHPRPIPTPLLRPPPAGCSRLLARPVHPDDNPR